MKNLERLYNAQIKAEDDILKIGLADNISADICQISYCEKILNAYQKFGFDLKEVHAFASDNVYNKARLDVLEDRA